ncbi:N-acetyltransferase domain-containing protein [Mycena chlorophos]|uniref:N-acetyltransferase domain-containing protein n=1 Tax=Mycena chlorophos TaxID=658473 RepID=A0A8H6SK86_MYCCL|nr:N-acetyltransferase domain-containing protein [Mycena chlorophos]
MSILRSFVATDLFRFNNVNLDFFTQTYSNSFYLDYLARWPDLCCAQVSPAGRMMGYNLAIAVFGKAEGSHSDWHGHITILTVAPEYRRLGIATALVQLLERVSDAVYRGFFVDLYVRCTNDLAIGMYEEMGYSVYRRVREYYHSLGGSRGRDEEDAFDMRKPLSRDHGRRSVRPNGRDMLVSRYEVS